MEQLILSTDDVYELMIRMLRIWMIWVSSDYHKDRDCHFPITVIDNTVMTHRYDLVYDGIYHEVHSADTS